MSNCKRSKELINRKLDNDLAELEQSELEEHLELCSSCNEYYQKMIDLHSKLVSLPVIDRQESIVDQLIIDIDNINRESKIKRWYKFNKHSFSRYGLAAAAVIVLFVPIAFLANQNNKEELSDNRGFLAAKAPEQNIALYSTEIQTDETNSILKAGPSVDGTKTSDRNYSGQNIESFEAYIIETVNNQLVIYKNEDVIYKSKPWEGDLTVSFYQVNQNEIYYSLFSEEDNKLIASYIINLLENKEEKVVE